MGKNVVPEILKEKCPECRNSDFIHDYETGETICGQCGLVVKPKKMDRGPDWRAFTPKEKEERPRVGPPNKLSIHDQGMSTTFNPTEPDVNKKRLPLSTKIEMWRLKKWQVRTRVQNSTERNLSQAMNELSRLSEKLTIPGPVREEAAAIYRKALSKRLIRGRSIASVMAAALYAACRLHGVNRNIKKIAKLALVRKKEIFRYYRFLVRELKIKMPVVDSVTYISTIAETVGNNKISGKTQSLAATIIRQAKELLLIYGKSPKAMAAAALYVASELKGEKVTQSKLADAAGVTEVTIRNRYRPLKIAFFVMEICKKAHLSAETQRSATNLFYRLKEKKIFGGDNHLEMALAIVYLANKKSGEQRNLEEIAGIVGADPIMVEGLSESLAEILGLSQILKSEGQTILIRSFFYLFHSCQTFYSLLR